MSFINFQDSVDSQSAECVLVIIKCFSVIVKIILAFNTIILEISWYKTIVLSYTIVIRINFNVLWIVIFQRFCNFVYKPKELYIFVFNYSYQV